MRATGLAGPVGLAFLDDSDRYLRNVFAQFRGSLGHSSGVAAGHARDRVSALLAIADDVQDAIMGVLSAVWPVCPEHGLGCDPREHGSQAAWWCDGGGSGHVIATVGKWIG
jgi:hypothetical protein